MIRPGPINWAVAPLLPLALVACAGVLLAHWLGYGHTFSALLICLASIAIGTGISLRGWLGRWPGRVASLFIGLAVGALYYLLAVYHHPPNRTDYFGNGLERYATLDLEVREVKAGTNRLRVLTDVAGVRVAETDSFRNTSGRLLVYLHPDVKGGSVKRGDQLLVRGQVFDIPGRKNPLTYNPRKYWAGRGVYQQLFIREPSDYSRTRRSDQSIRAAALRLREQWKYALRPYLTSDNYAVASALILGDRNDLSQEIKSAYADTGAIHVLAVSGLHVGIVAVLISWLTRRVPVRGRWWHWASALLTVAAIWGFALVTGLSSSVQRAAFMFSVLVLGNRLEQRANTFNLLALSALVMLALDPKQVLAAGFQLSYVAVAGILVFARPISRSVTFGSGLLERVKDGIAVSIGAQLGTLPLSLYHFQQFPLYFMLSGSLVVFFAFGVLCLGLMHGFFYFFPGLDFLLPVSGAVLNWLLHFQNGFIAFFQQLPNGVLYFDEASPVFLITVTGVTIGLGLWLRWKRMGYLLGWLILVSVLLLIWARITAYPYRSDQFVIYDLSKSTLMDVVCNGELYALGRVANENTRRFGTEAFRNRFGGETGEIPLTRVQGLPATCFESSYPYLTVFDKVIMILDGQAEHRHTSVPDFVDLAWVSGDYRPEYVMDYPDKPDFRFIVDSGNTYYVSLRWVDSDKPVYNTRESGAYRYFPVN